MRIRIERFLSTLLVVVAACSSGKTGTNGGNTNWLSPCDNDGDCGEGSCVGSVCLVECGSEAACAGLSREASCSGVVPGEGCGQDIATLCVPSCATDTDCSMGEGFSCTFGYCQLACSEASESSESSATAPSMTTDATNGDTDLTLTAPEPEALPEPETAVAEPDVVVPEPEVPQGQNYALLPADLAGYSVLALADGSFFIYGSTLLSNPVSWPRRAYRYDPELDAFTELASPTVAGSTEGYTPASFAFAAEEGRVLVVDSDSGLDARVRVLALPEEQWTEYPLPGGYLLEQAVQLDGGDLLVVLSDATYRFDIVAESWINVGERPHESVAGATAKLSDGRVLNVNGVGPGVALFDAATNAWQPAADPAKAREDASLIGLSDGRALLVGGIVEMPERMTELSTEIFDPVTNAWAPGPTLTEPQTTPTLTLDAGDVLSWGGLSFPCATATPCGGRAVQRLKLSPGSVEALPNLVPLGSPAVFEVGEGRYLQIGGAVYGYYDEVSGPLSFPVE